MPTNDSNSYIYDPNANSFIDPNTYTMTSGSTATGSINWTSQYPTQTLQLSDEDMNILRMILDKIKLKNNPPNGQPADTLDSAVDQAIRELTGK